MKKVLAEGTAVSAGVQRFGRYFARKRWFGFDKAPIDIKPTTQEQNGKVTVEESIEGAKKEGWNAGERGRMILVEVATAYAITKVLLPARVILSVWATPWFARNVLGRLRMVFGKGIGGTSKGGIAGTRPTGRGGVENRVEKLP